ncbi:hypothetical protein PHLGIDRAFT_297913 [Phlebiopsis gigantea 11061_1 CR5-6]|uniref:Uncharacterized protein n=1 Tax=Phlebiopsis gigantea (strain 11061_1 CR5-6) TaxID=745531 RepID=A0A0C3NCZ8_PHLG1|nr:hypothetical protein PHLGIDRAFT_297913 [Phlebiopsis gigantea 11061_1 CR5-6]
MPQTLRPQTHATSGARRGSAPVIPSDAQPTAGVRSRRPSTRRAPPPPPATVSHAAICGCSGGKRHAGAPRHQTHAGAITAPAPAPRSARVISEGEIRLWAAVAPLALAYQPPAVILPASSLCARPRRLPVWRRA